ncbi:MAG: hypothetical protein AB7S80_08590 [Rhizobiaceae bacterium]
MRSAFIRQVMAAGTLLSVASAPAFAWDSAKFKWLTEIVHPTHSYLTEYAIDRLRGDFPELQRYRKALIDGANQELHELPVEGVLYGIDLDARRIQTRAPMPARTTCRAGGRMPAPPTRRATASRRGSSSASCCT